MKKHTHRPSKNNPLFPGEASRLVAFTGATNTKHQDPRAHGGAARIYYCSCGAVKKDNFNQNFIERGQWYIP